MRLQTFLADNANDALRVVQEKLGPEAVIVSVRKLPGNGLARLLHRSQIEVTAGVPEVVEPSKPRHFMPAGVDAYTPFEEELAAAIEPRPPHRWRSVAWMESLGLLPEYADRLEHKITTSYSALPPRLPTEEWEIVRDTLATFWRPRKHEEDGTGRPHVFIGPPGTGKTTALCKWMTGAVLRGEHRARVWRLDAETANTAEFLSLHTEMLGVSCERFWTPPSHETLAQQGKPTGTEDLLLVDLPGVDTHCSKGLAVLRDVLFSLPEPHIHLVLNAAYDTTLLFEQFNAFAPLMPEDVIFTHLDEERRRVKLWNFVLGTNCPIGWLSGGQKIPGEFHRAESSLLFPHGKPA